MLLPRRARVAVLSALLCAAPLAAQAAAPAACPGGPADEAGLQVAVTLPGTPERAASLLAGALLAKGYPVTQPPRGSGPWSAAPLHAWRPDAAGDTWSFTGPHPGVQLSGTIAARGDSVEVTVAARTLCNLRSAEAAALPGSVEGLVERESAFEVVLELLNRSGPDARLGTLSLSLPPQLGGLKRIGQSGNMGSAGVQLRYAGADSLQVDVYVYAGPPRFLRCTPECGETEVRKEVAGFIQLLPRISQMSHVDSIAVRGVEAFRPATGDGWAAGEHVTLEMVRGRETRASHFYLYAFPGYLVKFRSTYPGSPARDERLRAFVDAVLAATADLKAGGPPPPPTPTTR